jgi:hypothetical protein
MNEFTAGGIPGFQAAQESEETQVTWNGRHGQSLIATRKAILSSTNVDSGNTPTTTLRGGNVLAIDDTTGEAYLYDPDATDGKQIAVGVLEHAQDMLQNGVATDRFVQMLVHGLLKEATLQGLDPRARQQLASRFLFDRSLDQNAGELMHPRGVYRKSANYTVLAADNGLLFLATAAVNFTLPTKQNGLAFRFLQTADADMAIIGSSDIVYRNNATNSSLTFSTASQKIGSQVLVECLYVGANTLKWVASNLGGTTATQA